MWRADVFGDFDQLLLVLKCDEDVYDVRGLYSFQSPGTPASQPQGAW